jgi:photosynthetic reaction center cytochrome c subunit
MRRFVAVLGTVIVPVVCSAQAGKFPPDSFVNVRALPHGTPTAQLINVMKNFTSALGVRCQYCHVGVEGQPLPSFDFITDEKRTKVVARQMMFMLQEINRRVDSLPGRADPTLRVTCNTCHRGRTNPLAPDSAAAKPPSGGGYSLKF